MQKMQIVMNRQKLNKERRYNVGKVLAAVDAVVVDRFGLIKESDGFYVGRGSSSDFSSFMGSIMALKSQDWFTGNVETWLWFNSDDSADPDDYAVEDIKVHYAIEGR